MYIYYYILQQFLNMQLYFQLKQWRITPSSIFEGSDCAKVCKLNTAINSNSVPRIRVVKVLNITCWLF